MTSKLYSAAAERNKEPIVQVLRKYLTSEFFSKNKRATTVLEISSGSGQHCVHFAQAFPDLTFQPSEYDSGSFESIEAYVKDGQCTTVKLPPLLVNVGSEQWWKQANVPSSDDVCAMVNINMIHISPYECTQGLMKGAGELLQSGQYLFTYGPYNVDGKFTSESNEQFHQSLLSRDARWGIRDISQVEEEANKNQLELIERVAMPANNFTLVFQKK